MELKQEKPIFLYHGSLVGSIKEFEPRKRYTPGGIDAVPRVYASDKAAFAAMHAFPWSSDEGIDIDERNGTLILQVPESLKERLNQKVFIYTLDAESFLFTEEEGTGNTYHTEECVKPISVEEFGSVAAAVEHYGGTVEFI